jgi:hypothetical protein
MRCVQRRRTADFWSSERGGDFLAKHHVKEFTGQFDPSNQQISAAENVFRCTRVHAAKRTRPSQPNTCLSR